ncbi:hypothetical protein [Delftia tsuruhatensis]|uniref:hypothetical protein n=1 Tax=Delftia tsuruhatensis TaxID=180282 RepID=UPI0024486003|nr:hypothetical protein [Delftia tsuruhatensis]MDH1823729.1 hypothetical protein [Delftia tsuruhatensis]
MFAFLKPRTVAQLREQQLKEAERSLLTWQASLEDATAMSKMFSEHVARLRAAVAAQQAAEGTRG